MKHKEKRPSRIRRFLRILGPGLVTGASDDDPSGIATYSQAGAQFGFQTLWTTLVTFPLTAAVQGMCARIGLVTSEGLAATLKKYYSKSILYFVLIFSFPAITLNIGADIQAMGAVANMLFPRIPVIAFSIFFTAVLMYIIIQFPYHKIATILKWLCITLFLYFIVPFLVSPDWGLIAKNTFIPTLKFDKDFILILVAILGTTISPYLFFWQTTMEAEENAHRKKRVLVDKKVLGNMEVDVNSGMLFSNLVMYFIILTTGAVLFSAGITKIETVDQAAQALEPIAGKYAYALFSLGVLGTGFLAIPVLAGAQSYLLAETFGWNVGLDKKFWQAKPFYITIIISLLVGLSLDLLKISPVKALLYTAILYGITAPFLIAIIMHVANNKKIMKGHTNKLHSNILCGLALLLMTASVVALIYFQF
jgi:NRAMP (natural resistance-associated macrophage protein)-like metal ion transporter